MNDLTTNNIYKTISELLIKARASVQKIVNTTMTYTYFEIGKLIVEEVQNGEERAEYGKELIKNLSKKLTDEFGKGFSKRNLANMKKFYSTYSILQKPSAKFELSFSHYIILSNLSNIDVCFPKKNSPKSHHLDFELFFYKLSTIFPSAY